MCEAWLKILYKYILIAKYKLMHIAKIYLLDDFRSFVKYNLAAD